MKHIDFEFNDKIYALSLTADALFTIYDKFGVTGDILDATKALEPSAEGWKNCCYLVALLAAQGELQRRRRGYDRHPMLEMEELRTSCSPVDSLRVRDALKAAIRQGFDRSVESGETEEVDLVLRDRESAQKKTRERARCALRSWLSAQDASALHRQTR